MGAKVLRLLPGLAAIAVLLGLCAPANAHPHVWVTVETTLLYERGGFTGFRHKWTFDEFYSAMAVEGLDTNNDGKYSREELAELAKVNVTSSRISATSPSRSWPARRSSWASRATTGSSTRTAS